MLARDMTRSRVAIGSDHAGFDVKEAIGRQLLGLGYQVSNLGAASAEPVDYPDVGRAVAEAVAGGRADWGVLVCGSGVGMSMVANKVAGIRAALVWSEDMARLSREHNDANVLVVGARVTAPEVISRIVPAFLQAAFAGGRHEGRVAKMMALDARRKEQTA
jgi:ribose 5-phosphate isomerase B